MASKENEIRAEKTEIIWMLEKDSSNRQGSATSCLSFMNSRGSEKGICVGDSQTEPMAGIFNASPFAIGRGFDMIVRRSDMKIIWVASNGSPDGNDNFSGQEILEVIQGL